MKPINVKWSTYIDFNEANNKEDLKFKVIGHVWISNYKNIFGKNYAPNLSKEVFLIKNKLKIPLHVTSNVNAERITGTFYKRNAKNYSIDSRVEKVINGKNDKLYVE